MAVINPIWTELEVKDSDGICDGWRSFLLQILLIDVFNNVDQEKIMLSGSDMLHYFLDNFEYHN